MIRKIKIASVKTELSKNTVTHVLRLPVLDYQSFDARELAGIVGNDGQSMCEFCSGDHQVSRSDQVPGPALARMAFGVDIGNGAATAASNGRQG